VMLAVLIAHVSSIAHDWGVQHFGLDGTVYAIASFETGSGPATSADVTATNGKLLSAARENDAVVVLDADGGDGPRLGVFDPVGRYSSMKMVQGRNLTDSDVDAPATAVVVSASSYIVDREEMYLPSDVDIVGYYAADSAPFSTEYVYALFTQPDLRGTYFVESTDETLAQRFGKVLSDAGYGVSIWEVDTSVWAALRGDALTYAYVASMILVLGAVALLVANWVTVSRRRIGIHRMFGATPISFASSLLPRIAAWVLVGAAVGMAIGLIGLSMFDTVTIAQGAVVGLCAVAIEVVVVVATFLAVVLVQIRSKAVR